MTDTLPYARMQLQVYVFSYNRGQFLRNALHSVFKCAPWASVSVIDDGSTDKETKNVLEDFRQRCEIIAANQSNCGSNLLGGLYDNMRYAFNHARTKGQRLVLFLQDDMQLVRSITQTDLDCVDDFFNANANAVQFQTCFMKAFLADIDERYMYLDSSEQAYLRPADYPGFSGFSDVGLFHVPRFFERFGTLRNNEFSNNDFAKKHGIQLGISVRPFMMYLPSPPSHRGRHRSVALRVIEWLGGTGFYPYEYMTSTRIVELLQRDKQIKPYAEQWLTCPQFQHLDVWSYSGGLTKLRERGGWRRKLGELLTKISRHR